MEKTDDTSRVDAPNIWHKMELSSAEMRCAKRRDGARRCST